jgi:hypothetical protein
MFSSLHFYITQVTDPQHVVVYREVEESSAANGSPLKSPKSKEVRL